ncbi:MAG: choice-of-anchor Q domain-containing protein [Solirubrobacteraceae bacterium]
MRRESRGLLAIALALTLGTPAAHAATFTVDDPVDAPDAKPGDHQCNTAAATCSLRAAIQEADAADGDDAVVLPAGVFRLVIPPSFEAGSAADNEAGNGDLDMTGVLTVRGAGARRTTIDGGGLDRVFSSETGSTTTLSDMTITNGDATGGGTSQEIGMGGGVWNKGTMTLERLRLVGNHADGGGAVFSIPRTYITIRDSLLAGNTAVEGGGIRFDSGGELIGSTVADNVLKTVPKAALLPDELSGYGGGIDHRGGNDVTIVNSTIVGNHANKGGGGLNTAQDYAPLTDKVELGRVRLRNTIIFGNTSDAGAANCQARAQIIQSTGHNLAGDDTCRLTAEGDLPGRDPLLSALKFHGGPTETFALRRGSPALDAAGTICAARDQRGVARPQGTACDIGAYEWRAPARKKRKRG